MMIATYLRNGIAGSPGLLSAGGLIAGALPITRPDLHFLYNLAETTPLLAGWRTSFAEASGGDFSAGARPSAPRRRGSPGRSRHLPAPNSDRARLAAFLLGWPQPPVNAAALRTRPPRVKASATVERSGSA